MQIKNLLKWQIVATGGLIACMSCFALFTLKKSNPDTSYWVWRDNDMNYIPSDKQPTLYLYQGNLLTDWHYQPLGVTPMPLDHDEIALVLRLYELVETTQVAELFQELTKRWARSGVAVNELQIDYDSPSSKLPEYASWLKGLNELVEEKLSVTGLTTHIWDNPTGLIAVSAEVDYLALQLYQGYLPHPQFNHAIKWLSKSNIAHKLGITQATEFASVAQSCIAPCEGLIVFLNNKE